jgi:hypothetical protein
MLWIDPSVLPSDLDLNYGTVNSKTNTEADFDGNDGRNVDAGQALVFTTAINEDVGGVMTPTDLLGWSNGLAAPGSQFQPFRGETLVGADVPNSAVIFASEQYGDVGLSTANQTKVAQIAYQQNVWTPTDNDAAVTFITPGFMDPSLGGN